ncbi:ankyrin repeat-containing domain protein [Flagelloscypha sp. PMI_526]|nr:ankyrin repeat-containing domain protein [Flagelloscypha sp. PMI_526]
MKGLVAAFPKASHLACFLNIGAGRTQFADDSETVAQDLLLQFRDVGCFSRLSMKHELGAGMHARVVIGLLEEEETSSLVDDIVEALTEQHRTIPLLRLINLAGEDVRAKRDAKITAIQLDIKHLRDAEDQSHFRRLKKWLKPIDRTSKLDSSNRTRGPTTCEWFLEHPVMEEWIRTGGLCWFHGGMGTGKTFIMSHLVQTLIRQGHTVAYYYFEFTDPSTLSEEALLRSLVFQLSFIHLPTSLALHKKHGDGASEPQLAALLESVLELGRQSEQPFYIAIDALDELPLPERKQLFKTLELMSTVNSPNMHVIVSSRDDVDITSGLRDLAQHKLDVLHDRVSHDIAVFVDQGLSDEKWKDWPPDLIERMRIVLNKRAAGQFRMVACQLELLHKTETIRDLEARLIALPTKLADTYHYILDHLIPQEERVRAQTLLRLLAVAFEAVPLDELAALIAVDLGDPSDVISLPKYEEQQRFRQPQNIVGLGTAFVRLTTERSFGDKSYPSLQLSHASVKEYLLQQDSTHWCYMNEQLAHSTMAGACLALLLHNLSSQLDAPIHKYVRQRWFQHVQPNSSDQLLKQQILFFEKFPWSQKTRFQFNEYPFYYYGLSKELIYRCPLIAASAAGLDQILPVILATKQKQDDLDQALYGAVGRQVSINVIKLLVENGADLNREEGRYESALSVAALRGSLNVVKFLVEKGAHVNKWGGIYGYTLPTLHFAAGNGHLEVVKFLVDKGADVNMGGDWLQGFPLNAAARKGDLKIVEFLVERGADVNKGGGQHGSALHTAIQNGHLEVVKFLVEKCADVNKEEGYHGSVLQVAAQKGDLKVVEFLVENGADVNKEGGEYGSALQAALEKGDLKVVEFLVEKGADVNMGGDWLQGFPLEAAAQKGDLKIVEFLVEKGADVNKRRRTFGSALHTAIQNGHLEVVKFLVEKGADVNEWGGFHGSVLQAALEKGDLKVVEFLVEKGADVNMGRNWLQGFPLEAAAQKGDLKIVEFLVEKGADVNKRRPMFGSALHIAIQNGHLEVVKFLVEKGADVNKQGRFYRSVLHAAAQKGDLKLVEFLVEKGADVNKRGGRYGSALHAAAQNDRFDVVEFLVKKGAYEYPEGGNTVATPSSARNKFFVSSVVSPTLGLHVACLHKLPNVCLKGMLHMNL